MKTKAKDLKKGVTYYLNGAYHNIFVGSLFGYPVKFKGTCKASLAWEGDRGLAYIVTPEDKELENIYMHPNDFCFNSDPKQILLEVRMKS